MAEGANNPLFYRRVVPLDREKHRRSRIRRPGEPFGFARATQFIPAVIDEFPSACRDLAIVFVPGTGRPSPVFVVGFSSGQNLLVTREGEWSGAYVPAFLRRYPFIRGDVQGGDPVICLDQDYEGLNEKSGEAFFDGEEQTLYLQQQVGLVNAYYEASRRTEEFCDLLQQHDLLKSITIDVKSPSGSTAVHGLLAIDEEKLNAMSAKEFEKLRKAGALPAIYAQLISLGSINQLGSRLEAVRAEGSK
jgi:hypothetical protein